MKHYGIAQWVDFARSVAPQDEDAMRSHLEGGCDECRELADFCARLTGICRDLAAASVPEWVVRNARSIFPAPLAPVRKRVLRIPVELLYDSFLVPSPVGLRATWQVGWQALYRAGDCSLDLRIEPDLHSSRAALVGQISNHAIPGERMEDIPVYVKSGRMIVAETRSNQFGEFQMEYEQQDKLSLCVELADGSRKFQVALKRLASDKPAGGERTGVPPVTQQGPHGGT